MKLFLSGVRYAALLLCFCLAQDIQAQAPQSSIVITWPKKGDVLTWSPVSTMIQVTADGEFTYPVVYEYTTNGGTTWEDIQTEKGSGKAYIWSFPWDVPDIDAPQVQIRISDSLGTVGLSEIFSIRARPMILSVRVNNNKFPVPVDSDVLIEWTASGEPSPFDIDYVVNGFAQYEIAFQFDSTKRSVVWHTPTTPVGNVVVRVQAYKGGSQQSQPFEVNFVSSVAEDVRENIALSTYPNPVTSRLLITSDLLEAAVRVTMTDVAGRVVLERELESELEVGGSSYSLDVSSLEPGSYLLTLSAAGRSVSRLVTISR